MGRDKSIILAMRILAWYFISVGCYGAPTRIRGPAYILKFVALFPNSQGPLAYCDYNGSPKSRNPCDFRIHFDVLFPDDADKIPYADLQVTLPNNRDYFVADPTDAHWPKPLPNPSYPGEVEPLTDDNFEQILRDDADGLPITLRITVFDRDDVGYDDIIGQEEYSYTFNDVLRLREKIQSKAVTCKPEIRCRSVTIKFMFYLLDEATRK